MNQDCVILRELAKEYAQIVHRIEESRVWDLHTDVNDLHPQRPIVLIDELPWHELNGDGSLTLQCQDEELRQAETIMHTTGIGVEVKEETLSMDSDNGIVSHRYKNQFETMEDVEKLHECGQSD